MKIPKFFKIIIIGLGGLTTVIAILIAIVFQATSGLTTVTDRLFNALKEGTQRRLYNYFLNTWTIRHWKLT